MDLCRLMERRFLEYHFNSGCKKDQTAVRTLKCEQQKLAACTIDRHQKIKSEFAAE